MKKSTILMLALILALSGIVPAAFARNEELFTSFHLESSGLANQGVKGIQMVDWHGDTCYAYMTDMSVYTHKATEGLKKLCQLPPSPFQANQSVLVVDQAAMNQLQKTVTHIVAGEHSLYGFNVFNGRLGQIDQAGIHWGDVKLDMKVLNPNDEVFPNPVVRSFITGQRLHLLVYQPENNIYQFFGFDLSTGNATKYQIDKVVNACHEQDSLFLFLRKLDSGYRISRLDTNTELLSDLPLSMDAFSVGDTVGGLAYSPEKDAIHLAMKGRVYRSTSGSAFETIAYVPTELMMNETPAWVLSGNRYAICTLAGVYISGESTAQNHQELVVHADVWMPDAETSYKQQYPDVDLSIVRNLMTAEDVSRMLITQDDSVDVFEVSADYFFSSMVKKGFAADLSSSPILQKEIATMDPTIVQVLRNSQGHIVAYPTQLRLWSTGVHKGYWHLVFGERPLPSTMDELMDAWLEWEKTYADEYPDLDFIIGFDYPKFCHQVIIFFMHQYDASSGTFNLNHPALRSVLSKLKQVNDIRVLSGRDTEAASDLVSIIRFRGWDAAMNEPPKIVALTSENTLYDLYTGDYAKIPFAFSADITTKTDGTLFVYVVNPYTRHMAAAIQFIECSAQLKSEPYIYYATHPEHNQPYENPYFQQILEAQMLEKKQLEETLKKLNDPQSLEARDLNALLDSINQLIENKEEEKWMISQQTISDQREMLKSLDLHMESAFLGAPGSTVDNLIKDLCIRYTSENMTTEEFLTELGRKISMMMRENK
mgnify:CR=1 FL=1